MFVKFSYRQGVLVNGDVPSDLTQRRNGRRGCVQIWRLGAQQIGCPGCKGEGRVGAARSRGLERWGGGRVTEGGGPWESGPRAVRTIEAQGGRLCWWLRGSEVQDPSRSLTRRLPAASLRAGAIVAALLLGQLLDQPSRQSAPRYPLVLFFSRKVFPRET